MSSVVEVLLNWARRLLRSPRSPAPDATSATPLAIAAIQPRVAGWCSERDLSPSEAAADMVRPSATPDLAAVARRKGATGRGFALAPRLRAIDRLNRPSLLSPRTARGTSAPSRAARRGSGAKPMPLATGTSARHARRVWPASVRLQANLMTARRRAEAATALSRLRALVPSLPPSDTLRAAA